MRENFVLLTHLIITLLRLGRPGGVRAVVAESLLLKHQLLILNRGRQRAPDLRPLDRVIAGACALFIRPGRILRTAIVLKPSTIMACHHALVRRKYRWLFTPKSRGRPGPRGPSAELVAAIVEMKRRNPRWGCPRIAQQIALAFGVEIDKDVVRRGPCPALPARIRRWRPLLALLPRPNEGQSVVRGSLSLRVTHPAQPLGAARHGPVHTAHRRLRRACRRSRRRGGMPDV